MKRWEVIHIYVEGGLTSRRKMHSIMGIAIITTHWKGQGITKGHHARYLPFHPMQGVA